jgi:hypothetical protein
MWREAVASLHGGNRRSSPVSSRGYHPRAGRLEDEVSRLTGVSNQEEEQEVALVWGFQPPQR